MERIADLQSLATHLGPVLHAPDRLAALRRLSVEVDPAIPAEVREALARDVLGVSGRLRAATEAGPTVPISLSVNTAIPRVNARRPSLIAGFDAIVTVSLSPIEALLAALWAGLVYPQEIPPSQLASLFEVPLLREHFSGVPDGAALGRLRLPTPPTVRAGAPGAIALTQPVRIELVEPAGTIVELIATATLGIPVVPHVTENELGLDLTEVANSTTLALAVDPASAVQPRGPASVDTFSSLIRPKLGLGIARFLIPLRRSPVFSFPGDFNLSKLRIEDARLWVKTSFDQTDRVAAGLLVRPEPDAEPAREAPAPETLDPHSINANLDPPGNVNILLSESAVQQGLRAVVASGQLAERINAKIAWLGTFSVPHHVEVDAVDVTFGSETINVGLDGRLVEACAVFVDFDFRATLRLRPEVVDGQLRLPSDGIDINLDNTDALFCALTGILEGPLGAILLTVGSVIAAAYTTPFNKKTPGFWQGTLVPGTDVLPRLDLVSMSASTGLVTAKGTFQFVPDETNTFVVVQVLALDEITGEVTVVEGATVDLLELGSPPPEGDDYEPPVTGTTEHVEHGTLFEITKTNKLTFPDVALATAVTERHGFARFVVQPDLVGGVMAIKQVATDTNDQTTITHSEHVVGGDAPDLAVTVTLPDGYRPIERQVIALNLADGRVGTFQVPIRVPFVDGCKAERQAVTAAEASVRRIRDNVQELRDELDRVPPSEKEAIRRAIRRIETQFLPSAMAARQAAQDARETCRLGLAPVQRRGIPLSGRLEVDPL